ncbi:MAG: 16S rRNA (adenine(1518)-N(6)/adenine(1519)-N(6))-dimethyltransferase RsmA [Bacteroidales bacterium]|jgi:16S rRNA (adenine1518-N6/adenine1519-N6)-dimethyltransferase|nr:16S rRNA (adenine(1518)-N(6)/adenine(1519)-N(6))-dimethyltransferase RsmA [Bacteroidales bacterium]
MLPVKPKKSLGQHFLNDQNIARKIAGSLQFVSDNELVVEIGPGSGFMTQFLVDMPYRLLLIETDRESVEYLNQRFPQLSDSIIHRDVLKVHFSEYSEKPISVIGNMPYNISGPLLFMALDQRMMLNEWIGMLQKEVADRIVAKPSTKAYGILSVLLQAYFDVDLLFNVPPSVFIPPPKVNSAVIRLIPKKSDIPQCDYSQLKMLVKTAFNQRRKTMRNSLKNFFSADILTNPVFNKRPEELTWREFEDLLQL